MIIATTVPDQIYKTSYRLLSFFELIGFFFGAIFVVAEQWAYEAEQLVDGGEAAQMLSLLNHCFADPKRYLAFV